MICFLASKTCQVSQEEINYLARQKAWYLCREHLLWVSQCHLVFRSVTKHFQTLVKFWIGIVRAVGEPSVDQAQGRHEKLDELPLLCSLRPKMSKLNGSEEATPAQERASESLERSAEWKWCGFVSPIFILLSEETIMNKASLERGSFLQLAQFCFKTAGLLLSICHCYLQPRFNYTSTLHIRLISAVNVVKGLLKKHFYIHCCSVK